MMEDIEWLLRKYGIWFLILLIIVLVVCAIFQKSIRENGQQTEAVWEPSIAIEDNTNLQEEDDTEIDLTKEPPTWEEEEGISILTDEEKSSLQEKVITAAKGCTDLYQGIQNNQSQSDFAVERSLFTDEQRKEIVNQLGSMGLVCVSDDINMTNYKEVIKFYDDYVAEKDSQVTIFNISNECFLDARTFTYRAEKIQTYYVGIQWSTDGTPEISGSFDCDVNEMKLTEKGYFIYTNAVTIAHGNLREYYRIKPLSNECRELTKKYVSGLSYVNYNMLVTNWNSDNVEDILMPCMFENIYRICTGERLQVEKGVIPAETYEQVMTTCFPVTVDQLRNHCEYNKNENSYENEMIFARQFPPFAEVVYFAENTDGSLTLFVDGIWPDYNSDYAFVNQIVVKPNEDGTFRYLSNSIEKKELDIPMVK